EKLQPKIAPALLSERTAAQEISIIPEPVSLIRNAGYYTLPENVVIQAVKVKDLKHVLDHLKDKLSTATQNYISVTSNANTAAHIKFILNDKSDASLGEEGYKLDVTPDGIVIKANQPAGIYYGVQTLLQLLPQEIESKKAVNNVEWKVPAVSISDYPR